MSRNRTRLPRELLFGALAAGTTWTALMAWRGFTASSEQFLGALIVVGGVIAVTGAVARWRRLPAVLTLMVEAAVVAVVTCRQTTGRWWPDGEYLDALSAAGHAANTYVSPVPYTDTVNIQPLLLLGGAATMLAVDLFAATLRRVPLAALPLLVVYTVPVSLLERSLTWWVFALSAAGLLLMLFLENQESLSRWGRSLEGGGEPITRLSDTTRAGAAAIGATAIAVAVVVPLAIPTLDLEVLDIGPGGGGDGEIDITNPIVDLRRDLLRGPDVPLIEVTTDQPNPNHLRISVLNRFSSNTWSSGDRDVPADNLAQGALPALAGVPDSVPRDEYEYRVQVSSQFTSTWLPTQAPISRINADGDWRYDDDVMDFLAGSDDVTTAGLEYTMTAVDLHYDQDRLLEFSSTPTGLDEELTALPSGLSPEVSSLARNLTAPGTTRFAKALILQDWFREEGGFVYDLSAASQNGVGTDELEAFLDPVDGRRGYCEQFSAAMAVMARVIDIPSRVAVGFLEPEQISEETYVYSAHDLHAWVELYFDDAGWVMFDPTPSGRVANSLVPGYTQGYSPPALPTATRTSEITRPSASTTPSAQPSVGPTSAPVDEEAARADQREGSVWDWLLPVLIVMAVLALLIGVALLPRFVRTRQRRRRLSGGVEAAWEELWATTLDLGRRWPEGRTPRQVERIVSHWFGQIGDDAERPAHGAAKAPEAVAALGRLARSWERVRYARGVDDVPGVHADDVDLCRAALAAGVAPRARRRATWLPRSWRVRRVVRPAAEVDEQDSRTGQLVEHL